jgi:tetrahydromethanopterin S-methyltransferase subunit H
MFRFDKEQAIFDIGGVKVGGQPGEYPIVLIPSIFYEKHKIVSDPVKGEFDRKEAELLLNRLEELSDKTGNSFFVDVMGITAEALVRFVSFVSEFTQSPFLVDSASRQARLAAMRYVSEVGLMDRAVYNSINCFVTDEELKYLKDLAVQSAVVLAFDPKKPSFEGRVAVLKGSPTRRGLLSAAKEAGISNVLVDTAVLDVLSIGAAGRAICYLKEEFGLPAGCGPANALAIWKRLKEGEFGPVAYKVCLGGSALFTQMMGANFVITGPIGLADAAFSACAMMDVIIASEAERLGTATKDVSHPFHKIL